MIEFLALSSITQKFGPLASRESGAVSLQNYKLGLIFRAIDWSVPTRCFARRMAGYLDPKAMFLDS